ncbi:hypothetical protein N9C08_02020 [Rubripirellula sp.]|nr:hypothetical protein [Rubripirellula sp.]
MMYHPGKKWLTLCLSGSRDAWSECSMTVFYWSAKRESEEAILSMEKKRRFLVEELGFGFESLSDPQLSLPQ